MNKKEKKFVIISISIFVLAAVIVLIISLVSRAERKKRLENFLSYTCDYCNKNFGDCWYIDGTDHINVHVWVPGVSFSIAVNPLNKLDVIERFGKIAKQMNDSAWEKKLNCGVTLWLHNDENTERTLYVWVNGELFEED